MIFVKNTALNNVFQKQFHKVQKNIKILKNIKFSTFYKKVQNQKVKLHSKS